MVRVVAKGWVKTVACGVKTVVKVRSRSGWAACRHPRHD
jgi:hypothetical protein